MALTEDQKKILGGVGITAVTTGIAAIGARASQKKQGLGADLKAACGRKPIFGKSKKAQYQSCVNRLTAGNKEPIRQMQPKQMQPTQTKSNNNKVLIIIGVVAAIGLAAYLIKKRNK
jgi:LPXTG-motif cell wall-anchored protein